MMTHTAILALKKNFLGNSPDWYKATIVAFLLINFVLLYTAGPFVAGWVLICEFIFTLAMALKCYPLPTGGLLAIEGVALGITSPETIYHEALKNFEVILLLVFMVAGIYFMKDFLRFAFTRIVINVRSKGTISLLFISAGAVLSAFLDALTVTAVIIAVAYGFYNVYHRYASGKSMTCDHDLCCDDSVAAKNREELRAFRGFLRNLMMHGAVGTALGGVCTLVGEPQNLLIGAEMGWHFTPFFLKVAPVSIPVLIAGLLTCLLLEKFGLFGYGEKMPESIRSHLIETALEMEARQGVRGKVKVIVQALIGVWLVTALAFHLAAVGIIGLSVIILLTSLNGVTDEHQLGAAFKEALPFTALLIVFFAIVAVIHDQHLFAPVLDLVLSVDGKHQLAAYYSANGLLSMISDNVFVATVYISETKIHFEKMLGAVPDLGVSAQVLMQRLTEADASRSEVLAALPGDVADRVTVLMNHFDKLAVAINTGTNIPSVATPNGQAAFLFLLTSGLAPVIRLSYFRMVLMALPYTLTMSATGFLAVYHFL